MGAQPRGQQDPWHVPAQILHPQHGVGKQTQFQAGFSLCWQCKSIGEMSSHSLLCPASIPTAFHTMPFPPFPSSGMWGGMEAVCAQRAGICFSGSLEAPLGLRLQMDGLGEVPAESRLETSLLALLSLRHVVRILSGDAVLARLQG